MVGPRTRRVLQAATVPADTGTVTGREVAVSPQLVTILIALGAASIALWVDVRFPRLGPAGIRPQFVLHLLACGLILKVLVPTGLGVTAGTGTVPGTLLGVFGIAFPGLVYAFLVTVWVLKLVQHAARSSIR
jgi:hypothetical protein